MSSAKWRLFGLGLNELTHLLVKFFKAQLEQLERLRSEDTPRRPMITPYYWPVYFESQVHIIDQLISDPKSKQGQSQKIRNFRILL